MTGSSASATPARAADARLVLAVDLGTSGCKCALVSLDGTVRAWSFRAVKLHVQGAMAEQDPHDWWTAFLASASEILGGDSGLRQRVVAVCCSTQTEGTVCVDKGGEPIGRAMTWLDSRGATAMARRVRGRLLNIEGYGPLKLWRWLRLTGGAPSLSGRDSAGHMAYIRDQEPERYERTHKFLNVLDYLNLRLAGRFCATQDSMLTAWVTDNRDLRQQIRYDAGLIRRLGIDAAKLPEIVHSTETLGPLLPEVVQPWG
jgi:xylulokinase